MDLSLVHIDGITDLVCTVRIFDPEHAAHLMVSKVGSTLNEGFAAYTLFNVRVKQHAPIPVVVASSTSAIMGHHRPSWEFLHSVIDLCSGFGGLSQGAVAAGFDIAVAVDQNSLMLELHGKVHEAHNICGDFGNRNVIFEAWKHSRGASVVSSGFSCQPFSRLGDGKGQLDSRASCLTKTLDASFFLNAAVVVLECVAPAANDSFVQAEIARFCQHTGYRVTQTDLKLDQVWPCRRHRAWWILFSPELGNIQLTSWAPLDNLWEVQQIIPSIQLWDIEDETQLSLDDAELQAFKVNDDSHGKYLLNGKSKAPCALHAWGSQTRPCPCGCRRSGFPCERLESKGLHGCIVRSAVLPDGSTNIRHLHPNEAMSLNTMDPVVDFGKHVRLTLSAVGQLAAPIQALWVFGFVSAKLEELRHFPVFDSNSQVQAYRFKI